jgi:hypothetical protein
MRLTSTILILLSLSTLTLAFRKQNVTVTGRLFCGEAPAANIDLKLVDEDTGTLLFLIDLFLNYF